MTDLVKLAERLHRKIKWQEVPEKVSWTDQVDLICDAIRKLYVISGRTFSFSEDNFVYDETGVAVEWKEDMMADEVEWILLEAQIEFYKSVQSNVDNLKGYSTDAISLTHSDKPYANLANTIGTLKDEQNVIWTRMVRYNQLGVSG